MLHNGSEGEPSPHRRPSRPPSPTPTSSTVDIVDDDSTTTSTSTTIVTSSTTTTSARAHRGHERVADRRCPASHRTRPDVNRSHKSAIWLGCAFFMNGLTSVSWFSLTLVPLALCGAILMTRYESWCDRQFWVERGSDRSGSIELLPFMLPYYIVSKLYGFKRSIEEVKANSAWPIHWLSVERRNTLWNGMGNGIVDGAASDSFPACYRSFFR